jgi:hypothetical protein
MPEKSGMGAPFCVPPLGGATIAAIASPRNSARSLVFRFDLDIDASSSFDNLKLVLRR